MIEKYRIKRKKGDIIRCQNSAALVFYPYIVNIDRDYLKVTGDLSKKAVISQLRLLNIYNHRLLVNNIIIYMKESAICYDCNSADNYLNHFFFDCMKFEVVRKKFFSHDVSSIGLLSNPSIEDIELIYKLIIELYPLQSHDCIHLLS